MKGADIFQIGRNANGGCRCDSWDNTGNVRGWDDGNTCIARIPEAAR
jgi:hypothetical protein